MKTIPRCEKSSKSKRTTIYTDGACEPNPGRGGYVLIDKDYEKRIP